MFFLFIIAVKAIVWIAIYLFALEVNMWGSHKVWVIVWGQALSIAISRIFVNLLLKFFVN